MKKTLIIDRSALPCESCEQPGTILLFEQADGATKRIGSVCWEHFTSEMMAWPSLDDTRQ
jgi:hypothetical protein